jgi:hypothetical protein
LTATKHNYDIENAGLDKIINQITEMQKTSRNKAIFLSFLSFGQGMSSLKNLVKVPIKHYQINKWYKENNIPKTKAVYVHGHKAFGYDPTPEQKEAAKESAREKIKGKAGSRRRKIGKIASRVLSVVSTITNAVSLYMSIEQLINEKSAKEEWDGIMKKHTEGMEKVKTALTNITTLNHTLSAIEMSSKSKEFLQERLTTLIEVKNVMGRGSQQSGWYVCIHDFRGWGVGGGGA